MQKAKNKRKNQILRLITVTAVFVCLVSVMSIEQTTQEWKPLLAFVLSFGWISLFSYANRFRLAGVKK